MLSAVSENNLRMIDFFLKSGANVNTGLYYAVLTNNIDLIDYFVELGATDFKTPLLAVLLNARLTAKDIATMIKIIPYIKDTSLLERILTLLLKEQETEQVMSVLKIMVEHLPKVYEAAFIGALKVPNYELAEEILPFVTANKEVLTNALSILIWHSPKAEIRHRIIDEIALHLPNTYNIALMNAVKHENYTDVEFYTPYNKDTNVFKEMFLKAIKTKFTKGFEFFLPYVENDVGTLQKGLSIILNDIKNYSKKYIDILAPYFKNIYDLALLAAIRENDVPLARYFVSKGANNFEAALKEVHGNPGQVFAAKAFLEGQIRNRNISR